MEENCGLDRVVDSADVRRLKRRQVTGLNLKQGKTGKMKLGSGGTELDLRGIGEIYAD